RRQAKEFSSWCLGALGVLAQNFPLFFASAFAPSRLRGCITFSRPEPLLQGGFSPIIFQYMAKQKTQFLCNSCGSVHPKWMGKCPDCGTWDALEEYKPPTPDTRRPLGPARSIDAATGDIA